MSATQRTTAEHSWSDRVIYSATSILAATTIYVAHGLQPAAQGFGTHEQLGLPPCAFFKLTGLPCPSCGMTTCFAHAAKFQFAEALVAQPFGLLLFVIAVLLIPAALYLLRARVSVKSLLMTTATKYSLISFGSLYLLGWVYKLVTIN